MSSVDIESHLEHTEMSSHYRHDPEQRVPRSTTFAAVVGVGLVIFGVLLSLWQQRGGDKSSPQANIGSTGPVDGGVLSGLQNLAPTMAGILVTVIVIAGVVLYKSRRHQD